MTVKRFFVSVGTITWAVFGFLGLGVLAGEFWLSRELDKIPSTKPSLQFVAAVSAGRDKCAALRLASTMEEISSALDAAASGDFKTNVSSLMRCLEPAERDKVLTLLNNKARRGNRLARRIGETLAQILCRDLVSLTGGDPVQGAVQCADSLAALFSGDDRDEETQKRTARAAQLAALLEAGIVNPDILRDFCGEVENIGNTSEVFRSFVQNLSLRHCGDFLGADASAAGSRD